MHRARFSTLTAPLLLAALIHCHEDAKPVTAPTAAPTASSAPSASAASSSAAPTPTSAIPPAEVVIEATQITAHGAKILELPADRSHGIDAKYKRRGIDDLYIVPLADAYPALDAGLTATTMYVDVDDTTPYRVLMEVLFTLGQRGFIHWELRLSGHGEILPVTEPKAGGALSAPGMNVMIIVVDGGTTIKTSSGNVAPGCNGIGAGITVPKRDSAQDLAALASCVRKLKASDPTEQMASFAAISATPFSEVWAVIDVVRGDKRDRFPDIRFAIWR